MALETFTPPIAPSPGTTNTPKLKLKETPFGDGYTQVTRHGINHMRRELKLAWKMLTPEQAEEILSFLEDHGGDTPFYYTPSDETTPVKWTCKDWGDERVKQGMRSVSATFVQSFSLEE